MTNATSKDTPQPVMAALEPAIQAEHDYMACRIMALEERRDELLEANNAYLERARKAERQARVGAAILGQLRTNSEVANG